MWCIPPEQNAAFVCAMENVLEVYKRPYNPLYPVLCMDETSKQLTQETRKPLSATRATADRPAQPMRYDYEYDRNGTANIFMLCEPLRGWRRVNVTERRTRVDFAFEIKELLDEHYPHADRVTLVMDNLNTHAMSSLYEAFDPAEARRLIERLEVVHTPKHGSWLNMAETELSALGRQCIEGRIADMATLKRLVRAWEKDRSHRMIKIDWQFTTADARLKLRRLYPKLLE